MQAVRQRPRAQEARQPLINAASVAPAAQTPQEEQAYGWLGFSVPQPTAPPDASTPAVAGFIPTTQTVSAAAATPDAAECVVCLNALNRGTFKLPACGHSFHALCLASSLQASPHCPLCRGHVECRVMRQLVNQLTSDPAAHGASPEFVTELALGLRRHETCLDPESGASPREIVEALRKLARASPGDAGKIPAIAALLSHGSEADGRPRQPQEVREAAVEALKALVPGCPGSWQATPQVVRLLQKTCMEEDDAAVLGAALGGIRAFGVRGDADALAAAKHILENQAASEEVRVQAADALQALAMDGDVISLRAALVALRDSDASVRGVGATTLRRACGMRGECPWILDDLAALAIGHDNPDVRAAAVEVLGQVDAVGGPCGTRTACESLKDPETIVRLAAASALKRLCVRGDLEVVSALLALVWHSDMEVRRLSIEALGDAAGRKDSEALTVLRQFADSDEVDLQVAAEGSLRRIR